ncbi:hypothetical protein RDV89_02840 [Nocardioides zeae]|uniref:SAF domain-containing protein n=1 Tax=Nocardioides imazamoxiresistens TaxID=3231893 RepID=A0ABU3PS10_9ACTN|nr:hypothetical protein [Nocardioides zeae]MDT9591986.1 hypothetical protein [Nocardioides zeae]
MIVAVSVLVGVRLLASADDTVAVWAARDDLVAGAEVGADDVVAVRVRFRDDAGLAAYLSADDPWDPDRVLLRDVAAGELVPAGATGDEPEDEVRHLPVAVDPSRVPPAVAAGSVVDVWAAGLDAPAAEDAAEDAGATAPADADGARLLLEGVRVVEVPDTAGQVGSIAERQLVLAVPEDQADAIPAALEAMASGTVTVAQRG